MKHFLLAGNFSPLDPHLGDGKDGRSHALTGWCIYSQASAIWSNESYASSKLPDAFHTLHLHFILSYFQKPQELGHTSKLLWARRALPYCCSHGPAAAESSTQVPSSTFPIFKHLGGGKTYKGIKGELVGKPSRQYNCCCCQQALTPQVRSGCFHSPPLMVSSLFQFFPLFFSISGADYAAFYLHKHNYLCLLTHTECSVSRGITSVLLDPSDLAS